MKSKITEDRETSSFIRQPRNNNNNSNDKNL
jgi:hypothetical protein